MNDAINFNEIMNNNSNEINYNSEKISIETMRLKIMIEYMIEFKCNNNRELKTNEKEN